MAKYTKAEARDRWRDAEEAYRATVLEVLTPDGDGKLTKDAAVAIAKSRTRADARMDEYFHRVLGSRSPNIDA